jgi:flagellar operon protein
MKVSEFNRDVNLMEIVRRGSDNRPDNSSNKVKQFKDTFSNELAKTEGVNFSKHARERMFSRGIDMSNEKLNRLSEAIDKAADKGSRNTLILDKDAAYVASVTNRTVISAFSRANLQDGVFTSIDSAVIL